MATSQDFVNWVCSDRLDFRYLKYILLAERDSFLRFASGTTHQTIYFPEVKAFHAALPGVDEQRRIADILSALDDRAELLFAQNRTLEKLLQALFKSWFVDFDPVRAKAEGRQPEGMDAVTAALFPTRFGQSELGSIPNGWRVAGLDDLIEAERGLSYKGAGLADSEVGLPMHNLNSVLENGGYKYAGIKFYTGKYKERHIARAGDVIVANTEQGHHHRLIGFPAIIPQRYEQGLFSHHLYRVRPKDNSPVTRHWVYHALMVPRVRDQIVGCANGSTVNMLKPAGLQIPRLIVPPPALCIRFEALASALHTRVETNVECAENLVALRDTVLPRLISGKLRLPEVEEQIEQAPPTDATHLSQKVS
jgi:type I restriction enzyme S subunit